MNDQVNSTGMGGQRGSHRFIEFEIELLRPCSATMVWYIHYCYRADSTGGMAREITKQIKFYVITKLECISRWKVATP